eukprot:Lankesteria_metandrocarpae@DN9321_c0_g1_i1.p1
MNRSMSYYNSTATTASVRGDFDNSSRGQRSSGEGTSAVGGIRSCRAQASDIQRPGGSTTTTTTASVDVRRGDDCTTSNISGTNATLELKIECKPCRTLYSYCRAIGDLRCNINNTHRLPIRSLRNKVKYHHQQQQQEQQQQQLSSNTTKAHTKIQESSHNTKIRSDTASTITCSSLEVSSAGIHDTGTEDTERRVEGIDSVVGSGGTSSGCTESLLLLCEAQKLYTSIALHKALLAKSGYAISVVAGGNKLNAGDSKRHSAGRTVKDIKDECKVRDPSELNAVGVAPI